MISIILDNDPARNGGNYITIETDIGRGRLKLTHTSFRLLCFLVMRGRAGDRGWLYFDDLAEGNTTKYIYRLRGELGSLGLIVENNGYGCYRVSPKVLFNIRPGLANHYDFRIKEAYKKHEETKKNELAYYYITGETSGPSQ